MSVIEKQLIVKYKTFDNLLELTEVQQTLTKQTIQRIDNSYAPYSHFSVSAGILLDDESFHFGANVENISFPVGLCAERNVLSHVSSNYKGNTVTAIAIFGNKKDSGKSSFISPCGMCRQAILEKEVEQNSEIAIILVKSISEITLFQSAKDLLPLAFEKF